MTLRPRSQIELEENGPSVGNMTRGKLGLESSLATYKQELPNRSPEPAVVRRWKRATEFHGWLQQDVVLELTIGQARELYRAGGGRKIGEFNTNSLKEIRDAIDFLLNDPLSLEGRFSECVNQGSAYALNGCGKEFASYLLSIKEPHLLGVWSTYSEKALALLGFTIPRKRNVSPGTKYVQYIDLLWGMRRATALEDFQELDRFLYWLVRTQRT